MAVVETERHGQILVVRMNRPERLNALNTEMRAALAEIWTEFRHSKELEVAIFTGTGRGFCAGEDMKESLSTGTPGGKRPSMPDPFMNGELARTEMQVGGGFRETLEVRNGERREQRNGADVVDRQHGSLTAMVQRGSLCPIR